jgi:hypothetical protein
VTRIAVHIDLVGRLYLVAGWLSLLVSLSLASLGLGAFGLAGPDGPDVPTSLAAAVFFGLAVVFALWAGTLALVGWAIRAHRPWARLAALTLAVVNLFVIPFGTALAVYSAWVLLQAEGKRAFERSSMRV